MLDLEYVIDKSGQPKAVVIPIEIWKRLISNENTSFEILSEGIEDYCLNNAMNESVQTPLLNRDEALEFLEQ